MEAGLLPDRNELYRQRKGEFWHRRFVLSERGTDRLDGHVRESALLSQHPPGGEAAQSLLET